MAEFKFNVPAELLPLLDDSDFHFVGLVIPKIKVEHSKMGKHRFYTELMEGNEMKIIELGYVVEGVVLHDEDFRILLNEAGEVICGAVAGVPYTEPPMAQLCIDCQYYRFGSGCKSKKRIYFMLGKEDPQVFSLILPPASLKHYRAYDRTIAYAYILAIKTSQKLGLPYQVWEMNYKTRGFSCIKQVIAPALLYEPCFVNNPKHLEKLIDGNWLDLIAEAIYETIMAIKQGVQIPTEIASIFRKDTAGVRKFFENKYA
jgi:hypothetical protein